MSGHYLFTKLASFSLFLFIFHQNRPERERERPNEVISFLPHSLTHTHSTFTKAVKQLISLSFSTEISIVAP